MKTKQLIKEMLKENTGKHFLDSGGAYGRHWQRNQDYDFDTEQRVLYEFYDGKLEHPIVSLYHYLCEILEPDSFSEKINKAIADSENHWVQECKDLLPDEIENLQGPYNTYNGENNTSQVFLFMTFTFNESPYVLLQIHQGCDVRGGYSETKCFKLTGYLTGNVDLMGNVNGIDITNTYNGYSLTDEAGEEIEISKKDDFYIDFCIMDETYIYFE